MSTRVTPLHLPVCDHRWGGGGGLSEVNPSGLDFSRAPGSPFPVSQQVSQGRWGSQSAGDAPGQPSLRPRSPFHLPPQGLGFYSRRILSRPTFPPTSALLLFLFFPILADPRQGPASNSLQPLTSAAVLESPPRATDPGHAPPPRSAALPPCPPPDTRLAGMTSRLLGPLHSNP